MVSVPSSSNATPLLADPSKRNPLLPPNPKMSQQIPQFTSHPVPSNSDLAAAPPNLPSSVATLFNIVSKVPYHEIEAALSRCGIPPSAECVEQVLMLSREHPAAAVKFFRWAGLSAKHTSYAWNLMVDLLGKNRLFEAMWDCIRSMKQEGVLSMATFGSVFGSYCAAGKSKEAIMSFDVMDRYGIPPDIVALNSLLSAICREDKQTSTALELFERSKTKISPDANTFAILLEGWEKEGNATKAKQTFGEMVIRVGWNRENMSAYDAFLTTLVRGSQADEAIKFLKFMKGKDCLPGMKFFSNALDILIKQNDSTHAVSVWEIMVSSGLVPNLVMYNAMIGLLCNNKNIDDAFRFLDEMPFNGAFPDSLTYNMIFQCLIKNRKVREATRFFHEMKKNEFPPTHLNCAAAIKMFFANYDPEMAVEVWEYMIENRISPMEESANALLVGLRDLDRLSEVRAFAEEMLDRRIQLQSATMEKLKNAFYKARMQDAFDRLDRRWKEHQN